MMETTNDTEAFWADYEKQTGEKVLARTLGHYISGWDEFGGTELWGLAIATDGGFRFHHFPHENWLMGLTRGSGKGTAKERTLFLPRESISSIVLRSPGPWWRNIFTPRSPALEIRYARLDGTEGLLVVETDQNAAAIVKALERAPGSGSNP